MATKSSSEIIRDGLWTNNPALVQVLGLCPLLAVTSTVVNAIGLGLATLMVLMGSNLAVSLIRNFVSESVRLPAFVIIIASFVTCAELLMQAYTYELYQILGIFIPLIVTNCAILGRADAFASKNPPLPALLDGVMMGIGFLVVLIALGAMRELVGHGGRLGNPSAGAIPGRALHGAAARRLCGAGAAYRAEEWHRQSSQGPPYGGGAHRGR